jgi:hypothetical protein
MKITHKIRYFTSMVVLLSISTAYGLKKGDGHYGAPLTLTESITLDQAIANLSSKGIAKSDETATSGANTKANMKSTQTPILVEAKVDSVCEKKGCWMGLKTETHTARVTFKDYKYFVPVSLKGKTVKVEGILEEKKLSLKETKHYVKDAGGDPSKVTEPSTEFHIVASGLEVVE